MDDGGHGPYALSHTLREEFEALRRHSPQTTQKKSDALDELAAAFPPEPPADIAGPEELRRRKAAYTAAHDLELSALCLSGGGIRSASFSLGVIQGLAERKLLNQFNYLSTVSGGGYIGSWLSAWLHRAPDNTVLEALQPARQTPDHEPGPIHHLREYSSYLTPQVGLLSADTWTALAIILRNILLNWLILIPAIALPVIGLKLVAAVAGTDDSVPPIPSILVAILCLAFGGLAFGYKLLRLYATDRLESAHKAQRNFLLLSVFPAMLAGACVSWLAVRGGTPADAILGHLPVPVPLRSDPAFLWNYWSLGRMLLFAAGVYLLAALIAIRMVWPAKATEPPRKPGLDIWAWLAAVVVFGTLVWLGTQFYLGMHEPVTLYQDWCLATSTPCQAGAKPNMALFSVKASKEVLLVIFGMPWFLLSTVLAHSIYLLLRSYSETGDVEREWLGRASGWHLIAGLAWLIFAGIVLLGPKLYFSSGILGANAGAWLTAVNAASGVVTALLGNSSSTPARGSAAGWKEIGLNGILAVAAALFAVTLLILLSAWSDGIILHFTGGSGLACFSLGDGIPTACYNATAWGLLGLAAALVMLVAGYFVNVNRFSLHALYRNRLIRAYLGASRPKRAPDAFTGFDWYDNLRLASLWDEHASTGARWRPFHVINATLNLAATHNLAWQQRKAMSFVMTPKFCGSADLGYRATVDYGDPKDGISLGTAMAISGAAVSPNMGYHSSPAAAFLLTMFDVRLGWWLGNPGKAGGTLGKLTKRFKKRMTGRNVHLAPYSLDAPWFAISPLLRELFGLTNDASPYVYLSDGGHFEDLALYEMVRRRCKWIIVCDAAEDRGRAFEDLGNAVRKIWIDLGVRITFDQAPLLEAVKDTKAIEVPYCAIGTIEYISDGLPTTPKGKILYLKPAVRGDESAADIIAYQRANADFPQQSTVDQWFDEPQIESYRALGYLMISRIIAATEAAGVSHADLESLFRECGKVNWQTISPRRNPSYDEA